MNNKNKCQGWNLGSLYVIDHFQITSSRSYVNVSYVLSISDFLS